MPGNYANVNKSDLNQALSVEIFADYEGFVKSIGYILEEQAKILIVEDELVVAMDIASTLKKMNYKIAGMVSTGKEAIAIVNREHPDLILMDIQIKGNIDGIKTAEEIQKNYTIPVIYLTAFADERTLERAKITEPYGYILKPYERRALSTTIEMSLYRNRMEKRLRESERWFSTTLKSIGDSIIATDSKGSIIFLNPAAETQIGITREEALKSNFSSVFIVHHNNVNIAGSLLKEVLSEHKIINVSDDIFLVNRKKEKIPLLVSISPNIDERKIVTGAIIYFKDITRQVNAEKEKERLLKRVTTGQKRLQILSRRLIEVQEKERRHIARELHDEIGQILTATKINLQTSMRLAGKQDILPHLRDGVELIEEALYQVRKLSLDLRPSMLDDLGLVPALRWYVDRQSQRVGLTAKVAADNIPKRFPPEVEVTCYRIVQESMTNVIKYAEAKNFEVKLEQTENELHLIINDDGKGFSVYEALKRGLKGESTGMLGMIERAELVGGKLKFESKPGKGTVIHGVFPLNNNLLNYKD